MRAVAGDRSLVDAQGECMAEVGSVLADDNHIQHGSTRQSPALSAQAEVRQMIQNMRILMGQMSLARALWCLIGWTIAVRPVPPWHDLHFRSRNTPWDARHLDWVQGLTPHT